MSAPTITVPNGGVGFIQDATIRPFVTGLIPVVGGYYASPLEERLDRWRHERTTGSRRASPEVAASAERANVTDGSDALVLKAAPTPSSTAETGDVSLAEIRRSQARDATNERAELHRLIAEAREAEQSAHYGAARVRYRSAAARARGPLKDQLLSKLRSLQDKP
jgi:hypothetical protein